MMESAEDWNHADTPDLLSPTKVWSRLVSNFGAAIGLRSDLLAYDSEGNCPSRANNQSGDRLGSRGSIVSDSSDLSKPIRFEPKTRCVNERRLQDV